MEKFHARVLVIMLVLIVAGEAGLGQTIDVPGTLAHDFLELADRPFVPPHCSERNALMSNGKKPAPKKGVPAKKTGPAGKAGVNKPGASWRSPANTSLSSSASKPPLDGRKHVRFLVEGRRKVMMHFPDSAAYEAYLRDPAGYDEYLAKKAAEQKALQTGV
jgi:hypothetical protein